MTCKSFVAIQRNEGYNVADPRRLPVHSGLIIKSPLERSQHGSRDSPFNLMIANEMNGTEKNQGFSPSQTYQKKKKKRAA